MSLLAGLAWSYLERWGNKLISLVTFIILARLLDATDFGLVAFAKLFIDYLDSLSGQGLGMALIQRKEISEQHLSTAFWINLLLGIGLSIGVFAAAPLIELISTVRGISDILRVLSLLILINALSRVQVALMSREQRFRALAIRGLAMSLVGGIVGVVMAYQGYGAWSLVWQQLAAAATALVLLWSSTPWHPKLIIQVKSAKEMYAFASKVVVEQQVLFFSKRLDEILISAVLGVTLLGYYSVAKRLAETMIDMVYGVLVKVLVPAFAKLQNDLPALFLRLESLTKYMAALTFPIFVIFASLGKLVVPVIFGTKWADASLPFMILTFSGIFLLTPNLTHPVFHALGKPATPLKLNVARALISLVSVAVGSLFGLLGVASAVVVRNLLGALLDMISLTRLSSSGERHYLRIQGLYLAYCAPTAITLFLIPYVFGNFGNITVALIIYSVLGLGVYVFTLAVFRDNSLRNLIRLIRIRLGGS